MKAAPFKREVNKHIKKLLTQQLVLLTCVLLISMGLAGEVVTLSLLLGIVSAWCPGYVFCYFVFRQMGATSSKQIAANFYKGEVIKLSLAIILLSACLQLNKIIEDHLSMTVLISAFCLGYIANSLMVIKIFSNKPIA